MPPGDRTALVDPDSAVGGPKNYSGYPGLVIVDPRHGGALERYVESDHFDNRCLVPGQLNRVDGDGSFSSTRCARVLGVGAIPVHEEGNFRPVQRIEDADLLPTEFDAVGTDPFPAGCLASEALLDWADVIDGENPAEPSAAMLGPTMNGLAEGSLQGCGVVERADNLDVAAASQRKNEIAGAERRVAASIDESSSEV